ncbi:MAG: CRTAC1 family protein [Bacteroidota bacterium]
MNLRYYLLFLLVGILAYPKAQDFVQVEDEANLTHISANNGVAVADYDQDGDLDIYFVGYGSFIYLIDSTWNRLMRNNGDGTFEDVTIEAGLEGQFFNAGEPAARGEKMGAAWGDYDNDGYPDLFLTNSRDDQLYHNNGDGTFTDVTFEAGVNGCFDCYSGSGLWWDYNRDGFLDLHVSILNGPNIMYQNNGDGTFENVTEKLGLGLDLLAITWTSIAIDVNRDGYLDLYDINDTQANKLWLSQGGAGFRNGTLAYRMGDEGAGMGVAVGDYDNDQDFDIYVTNIYLHHPNPLLRNEDHLKYVNVAEEMGVENTGWGWGTHFFDYDHDGDEDLYAVNGPIDKLNGVPQEAVNNFFYKNTVMEGSTGFQDWSKESGAGVLTAAKGLEVFDYDGDGDQDMIVANQFVAPYLFRNDMIKDEQPQDKNWLQIRLEGSTSNRNAFGSRLLAKVGEQTYARYYHGAGFFGQSIKPVHFGIGAASVIDELLIYWPSGLSDTLHDISANQIIDVKESPAPEKIDIPDNFGNRLSYNFPNPFVNTTLLRFQIPRSGQLHIKIYSSLGQECLAHTEILENGGTFELNWGEDLNGQKIANGLYFYKADFVSDLGNEHFEGKMLKTGQP